MIQNLFVISKSEFIRRIDHEILGYISISNVLNNRYSLSSDILKPKKVNIPRVKINPVDKSKDDKLVIKLKKRDDIIFPPLSDEEVEELRSLFDLCGGYMNKMIAYLRKRGMNMTRNPEQFPCEIDPGNYTNLDECETCERKDKCDTYITMLNETEIE